MLEQRGRALQMLGEQWEATIATVDGAGQDDRPNVVGFAMTAASPVLGPLIALRDRFIAENPSTGEAALLLVRAVVQGARKRGYGD